MSKSLKISFAGIVAATMLFAGFAMPAKAQTVAELQAMINQLMAQIAAMQGGSQSQMGGGAACTYTHSATLRVGSRGAQVTMLQNALNASGFSVGSADGVFGNMTANGVRQLQAAKGLTADGIVGPMTGSALANHCAMGGSTTTPTTPTTPVAGLQGTSGEIRDVRKLNQYADETVAEGARSKIVAGVEIEAENSGDIRLQNVRVRLVNDNDGLSPFAPTGSSSPRIERYINSVEVWFDGQKVGEMNALDFSRGSSDVYTATINLDSSAVIRASQKKDLVVAVNARSFIDSTDRTDADWNLHMLSTRFVDGSGAILTREFSSSEAYFNGFDFDTATAADNVEFRVSLNSNNPAATSVRVNETSSTNGVTILGFDAEARNGDMELRRLDVALETNDSDLSSVVSRVALFRGSTQLESKLVTSTNTTSTISFDDFGRIDLSAGDKLPMTVRVDFRDQQGNYAQGTTIKASVDNVDAAIVEDINGNLLGNNDKVGSAIGDTHTLLTRGANVTYKSGTWTTTVNNNGNVTQAQFVVKYDVTAFGDTIYMPQAQVRGGTTTTHAIAWTLLDGNNQIDAATTATANISSNATVQSEFWRIDDGQTREVVLTVNFAPAAAEAGFYKIQLNAAGFATTTTTTVTDIKLNPVENFRTNALFVNGS